MPLNADFRAIAATLLHLGAVERLSLRGINVSGALAFAKCGGKLEELDLSELGPPIESNELFPNRTNVSFWCRDGEDAIRARIFERGVGETMSSGTGATGAAVAAVLRGADSPVTVELDGGELEVAVGEDLHVDLAGWAVPVYAGQLSEEFVEGLREAE